MKRIFILTVVATIFLMGFITEANAQRWNRYRKEIGFTIGSSNMLGDLGGGPGDGSRFGDFQLENSRFAIGGFAKYRFHDRFAVKLSLMYAKLYATDQTTDNAGRNFRNLDVRTDLIELSGQLEFYILREKIGSRYKLKGVKGYGSSNFALYVFAGIGGAYYSPQGTNENGEWVKLAPLNTEGQGLSGAPKDYSGFTFVFPTGVGIKYNISKLVGVQFEASYRFTTTDYLDDVSTRYYDGDALETAFGTESKNLADKRYNSLDRHDAGGVRGHDDKTDMYMFGLLTLTYRVRSRARSRVRTEKFEFK
jgi:hypothetical protein